VRHPWGMHHDGPVSTWEKRRAGDVRPGDHIRYGAGAELTVSRIETAFMGRPDMIAFIEDTPERWFKAPTTVEAEIEVRVEGGSS